MSVRVYRERFPNICRFERCLRETSSFTPATVEYGRNRMNKAPEVKGEILERVEENPSLSTRHLGLELASF